MSECLPGEIGAEKAMTAGGRSVRRERAADAVETGVGGFLQGVLPDAADVPSLPAELAVGA